jgi:hypothetical protein
MAAVMAAAAVLSAAEAMLSMMALAGAVVVGAAIAAAAAAAAATAAAAKPPVKDDDALFEENIEKTIEELNEALQSAQTDTTSNKKKNIDKAEKELLFYQELENDYNDADADENAVEEAREKIELYNKLFSEKKTGIPTNYDTYIRLLDDVYTKQLDFNATNSEQTREAYDKAYIPLSKFIIQHMKKKIK